MITRKFEIEINIEELNEFKPTENWLKRIIEIGLAKANKMHLSLLDFNIVKVKELKNGKHKTI